MSKFGLIDNTLEGRQNIYFPHFSRGRVPLDADSNRRWRQRMFVTTNLEDQKVLRRMCKEDVLFFMAGFLTLFDAGDESGKPGPVPFIPFPMQVEVMTALWHAMHVERCPARVKKPRKMGLSWLCTALFNHAWQFMSDVHLLVGSHRKEEVDSTQSVSRGGMFVGEWSKLLPKFDFLHIYQPRWLLPKRYVPRVEPHRTAEKIVNPELGSIIWATSASTRSGHGERGYAAWWDEAAKTENLYEIIGGLSEFAPCKLWVSTIGNLSHPFSTILKDAPGVMQVSPEWWMHPDYAKGLSVDVETGKQTSPWLTKKLGEIGGDALLANQQYYADESMQVGGYYHAQTFYRMLGTSDRPGTVMEPLKVGELNIVDTKDGPIVAGFCEQRPGRWRFWTHFDANGRPPRNTQYVAGADIAAGTVDQSGRGASNSVLVFVDWLTGETVAEFVCHGVPPVELARIASAAGRWFEGDDFTAAVINYERNGGPGIEFGTSLLQKYGYPNIWHDEDGKAGWFKDGLGGKARLAHGWHQEMICEGKLIERGRDCMNEMRHYQHNPNGKSGPIHAAALYSEDPSGARDNHGDRVIARVVACLVMRRPYESAPRKGEAPWGSYSYAKNLEAQRENRLLLA